MIEDQIPKAVQLPHETLSTILTCLQACIGNVSQELSDAIVTITAHCNLLLSKQRLQQQPAPPQPGILRGHRGLDAPFSASAAAASLGGHMFTGPSVDSISGLGTNMAGLNLGAPANGSFNFNMLGNLTSTPASPSRLIQGQSNNLFPMGSLQNAPPPVNSVGRITQTPTGDKLNMAMSTNQPPFPDMAQNVPKDIEDEANSYFQRIYNHTLTIDEVLDMLQRFLESQIRKEQEVAQCMLRNLFEGKINPSIY